MFDSSLGTVMSSVSGGSSSQGGVTSLVTTGPDGTPIDEASQQSTLSNASAGKLFSYFWKYDVWNNFCFSQDVYYLYWLDTKICVV